MDHTRIFPTWVICCFIVVCVVVGFTANQYREQHVEDAINHNGSKIVEKVLDGSLGKDILR